jgi:hypothetical protein
MGKQSNFWYVTFYQRLVTYTRTCRARRRLVGDAAVRPRTGRLASESLDEDLHAFPETQHQVGSALPLDVVINKGTTILKLLAS